MAKTDFERVFGTVKPSKKNWDCDVPKKKNKKGKKNNTDLFGRKTSDKKKTSKKRRSLDKAIMKTIPKDRKTSSDAWLPIDTNEIENLRELTWSQLAGVYRITFVIPDSSPFELIVIYGGKDIDSMFTLSGGKAIDICIAVAKCIGNPCTTETDYKVMYDKLTSGKVFSSIDYLNTSLIMQI